MKEVKEVVHVPTRELAEEVLRVAKENGLMVDKDISIWDYYTINTYFRVNKHGSFGIISNFLSKVDKIITAQEFLSRCKPKFRPIAMKCNQEQFDAVRSKLVGLKVRNLSTFEYCPYLVNNFSGDNLVISNIHEDEKLKFNRQVFEEWNEKTFLEYCGIDVKDEVSELEQLRKENEELKKHYNKVEHELKQLNNELSKKLGLVKQQLKEIQDQPKVGDVCLFWDAGNYDAVSMHVLQDIKKGTKYAYSVKNIGSYINCVKATDENIKKVMEQIKLNNK